MKYMILLLMFLVYACPTGPESKLNQESNVTTAPAKDNPQFDWRNASIYFLLTDRFNDGDQSNNVNFDRSQKTADLRGFMGGDIKGITQKINEGYFTDLGIDAIWFTPVVEQIHGIVDEGTGNTYGYHGYWTKDWTSLDPNFGTEDDLRTMVDAAHAKGLRVILDVVLNHTGPVTDKDPYWGEAWARTGPRCTYKSYETTVNCTLVENLPDILTQSDTDVIVPDHILLKWNEEKRLKKELMELDEFFVRTGYPKTPQHYIMKWLTDFIRDYGVDGYRVDTAKHTEEEVWSLLRKEADSAYEDYKAANPEKAIDDTPFYMMGEVYNYFAPGGRDFDFGDRKVDYFDYGFDALINFDFKGAANGTYEELFSKYDALMNGPLQDKSVINYISSHDDGSPFDRERSRNMEGATKLALTPGAIQVYYGDEIGRSLSEKANGDASLRSFMNWEDLENKSTQNLKSHWSKLLTFRKKHLAVGMGKHNQINAAPYSCSRILSGPVADKVVIALDHSTGKKEIRVGDVFANGTQVKDHYGDVTATVKDGVVTLDTPYTISLLEIND